jgi:hypothetical protein
MPFNFCVTPTVNGAPETITFRDVPDGERSWHEDLIGRFYNGQLPADGVFAVAAGGSGPDSPGWERSWRWADIRDMWIEEV